MIKELGRSLDQMPPMRDSDCQPGEDELQCNNDGQSDEAFENCRVGGKDGNSNESPQGDLTTKSKVLIFAKVLFPDILTRITRARYIEMLRS